MTDCLLCDSALDDAPVVNTIARGGVEQVSVRCVECSLVQARDRVSRRLLTHFYTSGHYRVDFPAKMNDLAPGDPGYQATLSHAFVEERAERLIRTHALGEGALVYEVGCGAGWTGATLANRGVAVFGEEMDAALEARARRGGVQEATEAHPYDLVCAFHVLEHDLDPVSFAWSLAVRARPGGRVHVEVPDVERFTNPSYDYQWPHVVNFDESTLRMTLARGGLDGIVVERFGSFLSAWGTRGSRMRAYAEVCR